MAAYPYRSPLAIVPFMIPYVRGKDYCELGTYDGDIMLEIKKYAKSAVGIEVGQLQHRICLAKELNVELGDFMNIEVPKSDVYYLWTSDVFSKYEKLATAGLWILGKGPTCTQWEMDQLRPDVIIDVPFSEYNSISSEIDTEIFKLLIKNVE